MRRRRVVVAVTDEGTATAGDKFQQVVDFPGAGGVMRSEARLYQQQGQRQGEEESMHYCMLSRTRSGLWSELVTGMTRACCALMPRT